MLENYGIIKCNSTQFNEIDKSDIISYRKLDYEYQILVSNRRQVEQKYPKTMIVPASIDEIMLMYVKGINKMKGLLLKDFYTIKSSIISLLITFMVIGFGISFFVVPQVLIIIATTVLGMSVTTIFNFDKKSGWVKTSITFPTKKVRLLVANILCIVLYLLLEYFLV